MYLHIYLCTPMDVWCRNESASRECTCVTYTENCMKD